MTEELWGSDAEPCATLPVDDEDLAGYVEASQCDKSGTSSRDVDRSESCWCPSDQEWTSHHRREDHRRGARGYFVDDMEMLRCHQDVQMASGSGPFSACAAEYNAKCFDAKRCSLFRGQTVVIQKLMFALWQVLGVETR